MDNYKQNPPPQQMEIQATTATTATAATATATTAVQENQDTLPTC